jgi:hypothetical protein
VPPDVDALADLVLDTMQAALSPVLERVAVLQTQVERLAVAEAAVADLSKEVVGLRERAAVLETRPLLPGPAGQDGAPGPAGKDGTPGLEYCGVFVEGHAYDRGQLVTWAGAGWHCNEPTTTKPGEGSKAWTLMVKKGKDGRDGKDGGPGPEGPRGKDWQQVYEDTRRR